jgi:hypothetical protein
MNKVRNVREFTVAVSERLRKENWSFNSTYSRIKGMVFTLDTKLQDKTTEISLIQDPYKPEYTCTIALNNKFVTSYTYTEDKNIDEYLDSIIKTLENLRDLEIHVED